MTGWLVSREQEPATGAQLTELTGVLTAIPPLTEEVLATARAVARRQAGVVTDVLRAAVPARPAKAACDGRSCRAATGRSTDGQHI